MKRKRPHKGRIYAPLAVVTMTSLGTVAHAVDLPQTWIDTNANNNWSQSDLNWDSGVGWSQNNLAIFGGTGETVTLTEAISANGLTFNSNNYIISGNTLTLGGATPTATVTTSGHTATINSTVAGTAGLTKTGAGTLILTNAANSYTGTTTVNGGELQAFVGTAAGAKTTLGTGDINVNNATLRIKTGSTGNAQSYANNINLNNATFISEDGVVTYGGNISVTGANTFRVIWGDKNAILNGTLSGNGSISKTDGGDLILRNSASHTGGTTISGGTLRANGTSLGTGLVNVVTGGKVQFNPTTAGSTFTVSALRTAGDVLLGNNVQLDVTGGSLGMNTAAGFWIQQTDVGNTGRLTSSSGTLTINSVDNAGTATTGNLTTLDHQIKVVIENFNGSTPLTVVKGGSNSLVLDQANTYSGGTTINGGRLQASHANAFGSGAVTVNNGGQAYLTLGTTYANNFNLNGIGVTEGSGNLGALRFSNGTIASGTVTLATSSRLTVFTNNETATVSGAIGGAAGSALEKTGAGTLILTGTNTYSGTTNVNGGTLRINGQNNGTGAVNVASGARLEGTGRITGAVNVTGTIAPGASIESLSTGNLGFSNGSTLAYELNSAALGGDLLTVNGTLDLTGTVTLTLTELSSGVLALGSKLTLINYTSGWTPTELFTYLGNTVADDSTITVGSNQWLFNYNDTTGGSNFTGDQTAGGNYITMTVVPEPSVALLGGLGVLGLLRRRRSA